MTLNPKPLNPTSATCQRVSMLSTSTKYSGLARIWGHMCDQPHEPPAKLIGASHHWSKHAEGKGKIAVGTSRHEAGDTPSQHGTIEACGLALAHLYMYCSSSPIRYGLLLLPCTLNLKALKQAFTMSYPHMVSSLISHHFAHWPCGFNSRTVTTRSALKPRLPDCLRP